MDNSTQPAEIRPRYIWPWYLAAAVVLGVVIAVFAIRAEANRVKQQKQYQIPASER
jgi:F0F1-type ATP synthase assembly protein I